MLKNQEQSYTVLEEVMTEGGPKQYIQYDDGAYDIHYPIEDLDPAELSESHEIWLTRDEKHMVSTILNDKIANAKHRIHKYGHNDEASIGAEELIEVLQDILDQLG